MIPQRRAASDGRLSAIHFRTTIIPKERFDPVALKIQTSVSAAERTHRQ